MPLRKAADAVKKKIEEGQRDQIIPAGAIRDQLLPRSLPPATGTARGGVLLSDANPAAVGTVAPGTDADASRADHVHAHGNQAGGGLHDAATTSVAGFQSAADKTKEDAYPAVSGLTTGHVLTATGAGAVSFQAAAGGLTIEEVDASPTVSASKLVFPNGTLGVVGTVATYTPTPGSAGSYAETIGDGAATSYVITHSLGTRDVLVQVQEAGSPYAKIATTIEVTSTNTVTVTFATAPTSNQYRVLVGLSATGGGGFGGSLGDPNADRLLFWDDSAGSEEWLTLGTNLSITGTTINAAGAALTVEEVDASPTDSAITKIKFPNGTLSITSHEATYTPAIAAATFPTVIQFKTTTGGVATSITLDATPTVGDRLILFSNSTTGQISAVASTNTTWTQIKTLTGAGAYYAIWVGVVGASPSATITCTKPGSFNTMQVIEVADQLTPTLGQSATATTIAGATMAATTAGRFIISCAACDNSSLGIMGSMSIPYCGPTMAVSSMLVGYSQGHPIFSFAYASGAAGVILAEIT